jgi:hypothetical protein
VKESIGGGLRRRCLDEGRGCEGPYVTCLTARWFVSESVPGPARWMRSRVRKTGLRSVASSLLRFVRWMDRSHAKLTYARSRQNEYSTCQISFNFFFLFSRSEEYRTTPNLITRTDFVLISKINYQSAATASTTMHPSIDNNSATYTVYVYVRVSSQLPA